MKTLLLLVLVVLTAAPGVLGQGKGKGKAKHDGEARAGQAAGAVSGVRFGASDARLIVEYYRPRMRQLPPGLEKKLARGGTLPPGWQKKVQPFAPELAGRLGPVPAGCSRFASGRVALLINDATNVVLDLIELTR